MLDILAFLFLRIYWKHKKQLEQIIVAFQIKRCRHQLYSSANACDYAWISHTALAIM
jgi:hypothetical protein